ncbi:hypothetical protein T265_03577 [Opisthorchis viverrini]|uniref:Uncharacterized protein n=1 Tax=Opisthorchis viverrini TaxID=6198 RepID=A0A074ZR45_OPIVI|nr:hypothetical protein T265_03577 [Opisthorchis viverrini]KER29883.1 hypothetical protein T265_03577 [Opisthorchis viverrini]
MEASKKYDPKSIANRKICSIYQKQDAVNQTALHSLDNEIFESSSQTYALLLSTFILGEDSEQANIFSVRRVALMCTCVWTYLPKHVARKTQWDGLRDKCINLSIIPKSLEGGKAADSSKPVVFQRTNAGESAVETDTHKNNGQQPRWRPSSGANRAQGFYCAPITSSVWLDPVNKFS